MTDYIGPFGPASVEAALRRFEESAPAPYMARIRDFTEAEVAAGALAEADEQAALSNRALFMAVLSAAVSALDREELTGRAAMAITEANGYTANIYPAAPPYKIAAREAAAIAAIFPTEGEAKR